MHIFIRTHTDKTFSIEIELSDCVKTLKARIAHNEGLAPSQQRLMFDGDRLLDGMALSHYNIQHGSIVHLLKRQDNMIVFIKCLNGKTCALEADPYDLVGEIKAETQNTVYAENLKLVFNGKILDDNKTLSYYHIKEESTLYMALCSFAYLSSEKSGNY